MLRGIKHTSESKSMKKNERTEKEKERMKQNDSTLVSVEKLKALNVIVQSSKLNGRWERDREGAKRCVTSTTI
jgi:hypothetical protein